jgi:opacity protein-like surface antigen
MNKKIWLCTAFLLLLAVSVFAVDFGLSVGGGALLGGNFTSSETDPANVLIPVPSVGNIPGKMALTYDTSAFVAGAFLFVDATYAELAAAYFAEIGTVTGVTNKITDSTYADGTTSQPDQDYLSHVIIVDLLGKYPFVLNEKFTVFPALGVGLKLPIAGNENSDKEHDITWGVVAKAGAGLDFSLTQALFLRCEALFAYQFASDQDAKIDATGTGVKAPFKFKSVGYNLGPQVKIGVGYKVL